MYTSKLNIFSISCHLLLSPCELASFQYKVYHQGRDRATLFLVGVIFKRRVKLKLLGLQVNLPILSLVENPNLPIRKTQKFLGLLTIIILKRMSESIFFQSTKFTACKVKDEKEEANSLMEFNLLKIIHPFQGEKH